MLTDRQNEIVGAAIKIIAQKGVQSFTIKNLSAAIGVSEPAIYRHFKSKTEILLTMLDQFKYFSSKIAENVLAADISSTQKIHLIFDKLLTKFTENPPLVSVIFADEIFKNEDVLSNKVLEIMDINEVLFITIIENAQKQNEMRSDVSAKHFALMIKGALRLLVKKWELHGYNFNLRDEGEKLFLSLNALIKTEEA